MNELNHVAFIMDGNGRWGKKNGQGRNFGHFKGVETVKKIVKGSIKSKIKIVSFYVFSSENWKRPKAEINYLFKLVTNYFVKEIESIIKQGIKINVLGEVDKLSSNVKSILKKTILLTKKNEILNAVKKNKKKINMKNFEKNLYTKGIPDPDILIRTGGHQRLSNFMLWQLAYTELFFLKKLWPDFNTNDLTSIIKRYKKSKRNFGNI